MEPETVQAIASVAESLSTLALALSFIAYLIQQLGRSNDMIFKDWERQREREVQKED